MVLEANGDVYPCDFLHWMNIVVEIFVQMQLKVCYKGKRQRNFCMKKRECVLYVKHAGLYICVMVIVRE